MARIGGGKRRIGNFEESESNSSGESRGSSDSFVESSCASDNTSDSLDSSDGERTEHDHEEQDGDEIQIELEYFPILVTDRSFIQGMLSQLLEPLKVPRDHGHCSSSKSAGKSVAFDLENTCLSLAKYICQPLMNDKNETSEESHLYGTTIRTDKDEAPLGFSCMLKFSTNPLVKGPAAPLDSLIERLAAVNVELRHFLQTHTAKSFGWFLKCHSVVNMPPESVPPLFRLFLNDLEDDPEELRCDYYVFLCRVYTLKPSDLPGESSVESGMSGNQPKRRRKFKEEQLSQSLNYYFAEDEIMQEFADFRCSLELLPPDLQKHDRVPDSKRLFTDDGLIEERTCFVLSHKSFLRYIKSLSDAFQ